MAREISDGSRLLDHIIDWWITFLDYIEEVTGQMHCKIYGIKDAFWGQWERMYSDWCVTSCWRLWEGWRTKSAAVVTIATAAMEG